MYIMHDRQCEFIVTYDEYKQLDNLVFKTDQVQISEIYEVSNCKLAAKTLELLIGIYGPLQDMKNVFGCFLLNHMHCLRYERCKQNCKLQISSKHSQYAVFARNVNFCTGYHIYVVTHMHQLFSI